MAALEVLARTPTGAEIDLVAESNRRIANHLSLLVGMVQLQAAHVAKGPEMFTRTEVRGLLQETAAKIVSVGHLHRKLAHGADWGGVDLGAYLIEYCHELLSSLSLGGKVSVVERVESGCRVTAEQAQSAMLIVGEAVMNAIKHAHPTGIPVAIALGCRHGADGGVVLDIADDGVGLPENFDPQKSGGLGLRLIRTLANKIGAALDIESDSLGLSFCLHIPPQ
ncbi:MAG TPA: ATP-binding protein [Rhizomicrobium sp.]|jgi:two-component sensor histidine kinase|nr:ATP-binding protein [Rhizomicrobium sp.]